MNNLDKQYQALLQDILDNGIKKETRNGGTLSVFGRQIRHRMSEGFPLLTTKKMYFKGIVTELLWFLRGDTNIKYLVDNDCHIWDGDAYRRYEILMIGNPPEKILSKEEFINKIKEDKQIEHSPFTFAQKWGDLGPVYGKQWRSWGKLTEPTITYNLGNVEKLMNGIDQIANLINDLKTNPDSRRLMVSAWNVDELDQMVLPPCHYGFQVYTRELSDSERYKIFDERGYEFRMNNWSKEEQYDKANIPKRAISLMWNQRSVDTFLGLPFNIASYGLLLEIIAKAVNMVPDELIGNLGDTHLYLNHIDQAKEQIGREYDHEERHEMLKTAMGDFYKTAVDEQVPFGGGLSEYYDSYKIPKRTREPYPLPTLNINTEWWPTESRECGVGPIDAVAVVEGFSNDNFCKCLLEEDLQLGNYQAHPTIKAPLSN